jgi:hypothetical protein
MNGVTVRMAARGEKQLGPVAEDKDRARELRLEVILPALTKEKNWVRLDFKGIEITTQSFIHALIAEAIQRWGQAVLDRIEFKGCNDDVQEVISTVVGYSVRAYEIGQQTIEGPITTIDIPQADSLDKIRVVLDAMSTGNTYLADLQKLTGFHYRHLHYRLHAARILGLSKVSYTLAILTESGFALASTIPSSDEERKAFANSINKSHVMKKIAPHLLTAKTDPTAHVIARRISSITDVSAVTAMRRARSILAWRRQILDPQERLRFADAR